MALTPEQLAAKGTEHGHQAAVFAYFAQPALCARFPQLERLMFAIPNGGNRGSNKRDAQLNGAQMKAEGVKRGVPDIFVSVPARRSPYNLWFGLYVEMKVGTNTTSDDQDAFMFEAANQGYACVVCYSWLEAVATIEAYMEGRL